MPRHSRHRVVAGEFKMQSRVPAAARCLSERLCRRHVVEAVAASTSNATVSTAAEYHHAYSMPPGDY